MDWLYREQRQYKNSADSLLRNLHYFYLGGDNRAKSEHIYFLGGMLVLMLNLSGRKR